MLAGGTSIAIAVLCTTLQHSVTQFSHNPRVSLMLPVGNIPYSIVDEVAGIRNGFGATAIS
jgi:hypothetical protein